VAEDLSQQERDLIANLIRDGKPVPARYIPSISDNPLKTELIWPGKSTLVDSTVLPFQSIEHIDEPRKGTTQQYDLFSMSESTGRQSSGWTNKLIWGDNSLILSSLVNGPMRTEINKAGGLKLVYIDPPFDVGADFSIDIEIGNDSVTKKPSVVEEVAYRDTWGQGADSFLSMLYSRIKQLHQLMADNSSIFVHVDWRVNSTVRILLDEVFGVENYRNEIAWCYSGPASTKVHLPRKHDSILFYVKGSPIYAQPRVPHKSGVHNTGQVFGGSSSNASEEKQNEMEARGKALEDWWDDVYTADRYRSELVGYPTQKPESLLKRIIEMTTEPGDLVADFFCGSGTTLAVAEKLGRKWIGTDLGRFAIHTSRKRLISIQRSAASAGQAFRAFEILNLGGYERAHQVGVDASLDVENRKVQAKIKREEFVDLILTAYGAQKSDQLAPFSGSKSGTAILIGEIDAAVTQDQVQQAIDVALSVGL
jgi:DNA modification methylase